MNSTQISSRYSSAGNSGYDDDFEADADDLDGELELAQASGDEHASPELNVNEQPGADTSYEDHFAGDASKGAGSESLQPDPRSSGDEEMQDAREPELEDQSPVSERLAAGQPASPPASSRPLDHFPGQEVGTGSPASPQAPLPPLNPTVSPYLPRAVAQPLTNLAASPAPAPAAPIAVAAASQPPRLPPTYPSSGQATSQAGAPHPSSSRGGSGGGSLHPQPSTLAAVSEPPASHASYPPHHPYRHDPSDPHQIGSAPGPGAAMPALALALLQGAGHQSMQQQQLAAAISHSVEVLRASEQARQLQAAVEALTAQLVASERGRSAAEAALVELTQRMQEQEKRLNESWEAKVLEKQREVQQLRTKVQQLESQGIKGRLAAASGSTTNPRGSQQGAGGGGGISPEEAAGLRKELEQTEMLIRGYQQENEAATRRIKELEESLAAAQSRAAEEVLRTERAVLLARDDASRRNVDTATKLARVLALEKELAGVKEEAQMREAELKAQLEKLRAEKKALEARAGGEDLKAMAEGDVLVKQMREEMDASRQTTQALIQEMQAKLSWYAENQELLNKNDALVAEQRDTIQQLQARLAQYEGPGGKGASASRLATAQARIRELEAQVEQLNKTLRSRAPGNSLAAVVAAARPSPEETQLVSELQDKVEELEDRLRRKDEEFELQLRSYQQSFEKLKAQYSERASRLDAVGKVRGRVKELERQLEDQKSIFKRRVQELEARLKASHENGATVPSTPLPGAQYPAPALQTPTKGLQHGQQQVPPGSAVSRRDDLVPAAHLRAKELEIKKLVVELDRRSKQVSELHLKLGEVESRNVRLQADLRRAQQSHVMGQSPRPSRSRNEHLPHDERPVGGTPHGARQKLEPYGMEGVDDGDGPATRQASAELLDRLESRCGNLTVENSNLRGQVQALTQQLSSLRQELDDARAAAARPAASEPAAVVADLRRKVEAAELALVTVQRAANEAVERAALATAEHQRSMLRLHDEVAYKEGLKWQERLATLEQELRVAQQRCEQLEAELAVARSRGAGSWSPEASAFAAMERRIDDMARDMASREAKWRAVLQDTQSMHGVQADAQRRKWESLLASKEAEIQATRGELQALLQEVAQVQELQSRVVAKQQRSVAKM